MIDRRIYFEESSECPEANTTILYFIAPADMLGGKYPEAESMEISVEFPTAYPEARNAAVMFSPTKDGEDYDWFSVSMPLDEIEELMRLAERSNQTGCGADEKAIADWRPELNRIADRLGRAELLAQLAEEASELSQAALKLRRVLDGRNPTPVTEESAVLHLQEELTDVLLCAITVGIDKAEVERFIRAKSARWSARVEGDKDDV